MTTRAFLLASGMCFALAGCLSGSGNPGTPFGGGAPTPSSPTGGGSTGGSSTPSTGGSSGGGTSTGGTATSGSSKAAADGIAAVRRYSLDVQINLSDPTNPVTRYLVNDRNKEGGLAVAFREDGSQKGYLELANAGDTLENNPWIEVSGPVQDGKTGDGYDLTNYVRTPSQPGEQAHTLSVVDFDYARYGIATVTDAANSQFYITAYYGANSDSVVRELPSGSATYSGEAGTQIITREGVAAGEGVLTLRYETNGVTGTITDILVTDQTGASETVDIKVMLENGSLNGVDFSGDVRVLKASDGSALLNTSGANGRADFQGGFFGPGGAEVAGNIDVTGTATADGTRFDLIGGFAGDKQ